MIPTRFHVGVEGGSLRAVSRLSREFYEIVALIEQKLQEVKSNAVNSVVKPYLAKITKNHLQYGFTGWAQSPYEDRLVRVVVRAEAEPVTRATYDLICGLVQVAKTIAINIVAWSLHIHYGVNVVFLTKNLNSIRMDTGGKFKSGFLPDLIDQVLDQYVLDTGRDLSSQERAFFHLKPCTYTSKDTPKFKHGQLPIYLMNKDNHKSLLCFYQNCMDKSTVFIMDEIHDMYTDQNNYMTHGGLKSIPGKVSCRYMIDYITYQSKKSHCALLGVTATPFRPMTCPPLAKYCPQLILEYQADPPFSDATYRGFDRSTMSLTGIEVEGYSGNADDIFEYLDMILAERSYTTVPCILINLENFEGSENNAGKLKMAEAISETYGDLVFCRTMIDADHKHPLAPRYNLPSCGGKSQLEHFFDPRNLTQPICEMGAMILISRDCVNAGVSVRAPVGSVPCEQTYDGVRYQCNMLTDQFIDLTRSSYVEAIIQRLRIMGWYPSGHQPRLWVPEDSIGFFKYDLCAMYYHFLDSYNPHLGGLSIPEVPCMHNIRGLRITARGQDDCYGADKQFNMLYQVVELSSVGTDWTEVPVELIKLADHDLGEFEDTIIRPTDRPDDAINGRSSVARAIRDKLSDVAGVPRGNHLYVDWGTTERSRRLHRAPMGVNTDRKSYHLANALYLTPELPLKDGYIIKFRQEWDTRERLTKDDRRILYYRINDTQVMRFQYKKTVGLKYVDTRTNWEYTAEHMRVLTVDMENLIKCAQAGMFHSYYTMLQAILKQLGKSSVARAYNQRIKLNAALHAQLQQLSKTQSKTDAIPETNRLLQEYFPELYLARTTASYQA